MGSIAGSKKLKRQMAPTFWGINRKEKRFVITVRPGSHPKNNSIPTAVLLRDTLKKVKTLREAKSSIYGGKVKVDGVIQKSLHHSIGLMDVIELEGDVLAASPDDISSQPDKSGRRWITFSSLMNPSTAADPGLGGGSKLKGIDKDIEKLLTDILLDKDTPYDVSKKSELNLAWVGLGMHIGGKEKSLIIKDYIDGMEKIMKKHSKSLRSVLTDYTKKRTLEPDPDSGDVAMWDELVVNNFTIQKIHVGPEFSPDFAPLVKGDGDRMYTFGDRDADIEGFPFELYYEVGDMVDYINRTLK